MKMKNVEDAYPLSPMQQLMLVHTLSAPQSDVLFNQFHYTIDGPLNVSAFEQAWQQIVDRHPVLRTIFIWEGLKNPLQVVRQQVKLSWEQKDWRHLPPDRQKEQLQTFLIADQAQRFNLSQTPPMRLTLIQTSDNHYDLLWSSHHLLLDRWCLTIVMKELAAFYQAFCHGQAIDMVAPSPYRNYIAWLQRQDQAKAKAFWQDLLAGMTGPTRLIAVGPSESTTAGEARYSQYQASLPATITKTLRLFAQKHHLTLSTVVQGAWAVLLGQYSGEDDVVFGITTSGRPPDLAGIDTMMGTFINNLPVRVSISAQDSLADWLKTVQKQQLQLRSIEHTSLVQIQEWCGWPQRLQLFESLLIFQAPVEAELALAPDLYMHNQPGQLRTNYPLTLVATESRSELALWLICDCGHFDSGAIEHMMEHLIRLLQSMAANPDQLLPDLPGVTEGIEQQLLTKRRAVQPGQVQPNDHFSKPPRRTKNFVAPRNVLEHQLVKIWEQILEKAPIGIRDNFFALGGHSLLAIRLFAHIEEAFDRKIPVTLLSQATTVEELAEILCQNEAATALLPLVPIQTGGSKRPVFYVSPPGEAMLSFGYFVHHLGSDQPFYGLQPLGLNGERAPYTQVEDMAAHFIKEIQTVQPEGPYLLTGTCFGGMVAVELARQLQDRGQQVALLALFDTPFPNPTLSSKVQWHLLSLMRLEPKEMVDYILKRLKTRGAKIIGKLYLKRTGSIPAHLRDGYARAGVAQAVNTYIPQRYNGKIILFRAKGDVVEDGSKKIAGSWQDIATEGVEVHLVPGRHGSIMSEPHVRTLAEKFQTCLDQIQLAITHPCPHI